MQRRSMRRIILVLLLALAAAPAAVGANNTIGKPPPAMSANKARFIVERPSDDFLYGMTAARLKVNDQVVGAIMRGQTLTLEVEPCDIRIAADAEMSMGSSMLQFQVEPGMEIRLQLTTRGSHFVGALGGLAGMVVEAAASDNKGAFTLTHLTTGYAPQGDSLEQRILSLNALYAKGVFTQAEYQERRRAILDMMD